MSPLRVAILVGSTRVSSNTAAIAAFLASRLDTLFPGKYTSTLYSPLQPFNLISIPHNSIPPMAVANPDAYEDEVIQKWANELSLADLIIVTSPVYNQSYSGALKIMLDHIYNEVKDKPVAIFTQAASAPAAAIEPTVKLFTKLHANIVSTTPIPIPRPATVPPNKLEFPCKPDSINAEFFNGLGAIVDEGLSKLDAAAKPSASS